MGAAEALEPEFLSAIEAAKLLRMNRKTLYSLVKRKKLPGARQFGRVIRVHRRTLLKSMGVDV